MRKLEKCVKREKKYGSGEASCETWNRSQATSRSKRYCSLHRLRFVLPHFFLFFYKPYDLISFILSNYNFNSLLDHKIHPFHDLILSYSVSLCYQQGKTVTFLRSSGGFFLTILPFLPLFYFIFYY